MLAHLALGHATQRKCDPRETSAIEVIEHVRLILGWIDRGVQLGSVGAGDDAGVVPRGELLEAQVEYAREHQVEAHEGVAPNAGVGRPALEVVAMKWLDHALAELGFQVPAVIGNAEDGCHAPGVFDRRQRTAAAVLGRLLGFASRPLLKRDPDDAVALRLQQGSGHRRINPARHRNRDPHVRASTIWRATISASSPTPWRIDDFSFRMKCTPMKYRPGTVVRPSVWMGKPMSSKIGNFTQPYSGR